MPRFNTPANPGHRVFNRWSRHHLLHLATAAIPDTRILAERDYFPILPDFYLWDIWPVQLDNGELAPVLGGSLWIMLSAARRGDPEDRHDRSHMRLLWQHSDVWIDCGALLPDDLSPGSREWSGSARLHPATGAVTLWFTAAGRKNGAHSHFEQRLFQCGATLDRSGPRPRLTNWTVPHESAVNDGRYYAVTGAEGEAALPLKGFRDPYWFRDPQDDQGYILFTGSKPAHQSRSSHSGVIGMARSDAADGCGTFTLLPPLIDAEGVTYEMERPHILAHDGHYYLFWSVQAGACAPDIPSGPSGLYGMVAHTLTGPYTPLNGSGLVIANPPERPRQAYAWQVLPSLEVVSFVDYPDWHSSRFPDDPEQRARLFAGTIAPVMRIAISGATTRLIEGGK